MRMGIAFYALSFHTCSPPPLDIYERKKPDVLVFALVLFCVLTLDALGIAVDVLSGYDNGKWEGLPLFHILKSIFSGGYGIHIEFRSFSVWHSKPSCRRFGAVTGLASAKFFTQSSGGIHKKPTSVGPAKRLDQLT